MQDKKYYSISEVTNLLNIPSHQLRYLEKKLPELVIHQIRNRRYYTSNNITYLKDYLAKNILIDSEESMLEKSLDNHEYRINKLIKNFQNLAILIKQVIA
jgi:DNA-binding transcriptional MerR regulator